MLLNQFIKQYQAEQKPTERTVKTSTRSNEIALSTGVTIIYGLSNNNKITPTIRSDLSVG